MTAAACHHWLITLPSEREDCCQWGHAGEIVRILDAQVPRRADCCRIYSMALTRIDSYEETDFLIIMNLGKHNVFLPKKPTSACQATYTTVTDTNPPPLKALCH